MSYAYYNEYDPQAAQWLRGLIKENLICPGVVDERSITEVKPDDIKEFIQCHFFAGIGGWSYALRLAGWSDDRPVWTGSPPCQPFSNAGKRKAQADTRHLWPVFFNLIRECQPSVIFGEQVEAAIRTGWLDDLQDDLETQNYATGKIVLPACSVSGYHIRQRIWFVAERMGDASTAGLERHNGHGNRSDEPGRIETKSGRPVAQASGNGWLANTDSERHVGVNALLFRQEPGRLAQDRAEVAGGCEASRLADTASDRRAGQGQRWPAEKGREPQPGTAGELSQGFERPGDNGGLAESDSAGRHNQTPGHGNTIATEGCNDRPEPANAPDSIWGTSDWLFCRDGKWRPVEPGTFPLAHGISERVVRLRGYGNAIVPQVAARVISAYMEGQHGTTY